VLADARSGPDVGGHGRGARLWSDVVEDDRQTSWIGGTGPRLITLAEAAEILRVSEQALEDWIAADLIAYETLPSGEHRIRLLDEQHEVGPIRRSSLVSLDLHSGVDHASAELFAKELPVRRRERELEGLAWSEVDAARLTALLAEALASAVPATVEVSVEDRLIWVAGSGVDVGQLVADAEASVEDRILLAAERLLEIASDAISEEIAEPWPASAGQFAGGFPPYEAVISDGQLLMRYGDPTKPILTFPPISVNDVVL
jgi:hypothetical protein